MGLLDRLHALANRLGLIHVAQRNCDPVGPAIRTRSISLRDLATDIRTEQLDALASLPAEMSVSFDRIYEAAGVTGAESGWSIERVSQTVRTEPYSSMDRSAAQQALLTELDAQKVSIERLVQDAVARDKTLDAYEAFLKIRIADRQAARQHRIDAIDEQIHELHKQRAALAAENADDQAQWQQWLQRKREAEDVLAHALGYLVVEPLITRDE
jgi:hypothetical protein